MREIKFRGKRLDSGIWAQGFLYEAQDRAWIICEIGIQHKPSDVEGPAEYDTEPIWVEVDPKTVGQYTGLKDKNGAEIYEGDIAHYWFSEEPKLSPQVYKIIWCEELSGFDLEDDNDTTESLAYSNASYEVIGNIYENPELLK